MPSQQHIEEADAGLLPQIFESARTHSHWLSRPLSDALLRSIYDRARFGPTSLNGQPMRIVFVRTRQGKERLRRALTPGNIEKTVAAPATAIVAYDLEFYSHLPRLYPQRDVRAMFASNSPLSLETAFRNSTLQGAYLMLAARSLGLDVGPMSGFDRDVVDAEFFAHTRIRSNFLFNIGYGDASKLKPRNDRLTFDEACRFE